MLLSLENLLLTLDTINSANDLCSGLEPALRLVGYVVLGIKIVVPIVLIVVGMLDLAKAVAEKDDKKIKEAQQLLIKRAIAAALVFLVITIVGVLMKLIGNEDYSDCMQCITNPSDCSSDLE